MRSNISLLAIVTSLLGACTSTPTMPPSPPAPAVETFTDALLLTCEYRYWHVRPGAKWTYRVTSKGSNYPHPTGEMNFDRSEEVVGVTPGEFRIAFTSTDSNEPPWVKIFRCGESGPAEIPNEIMRANSMRTRGLFIPANLDAASQWESTFESGSSVSLTQFRAAGQEHVTVAAGSFDAIRVDYVRTDRGESGIDMKVEGSLWFAPDVGVVKETFRQTTTVDKKTREGQTLQGLVSFRP